MAIVFEQVPDFLSLRPNLAAHIRSQNLTNNVSNSQPYAIQTFSLPSTFAIDGTTHVKHYKRSPVTTETIATDSVAISVSAPVRSDLSGRFSFWNNSLVGCRT